MSFVISGCLTLKFILESGMPLLLCERASCVSSCSRNKCYIKSTFRHFSPSYISLIFFRLHLHREIYRVKLKWEELTYCCDDISIPVDSLSRSFACCSSLYLILFYDFKKWSILMLLLLLEFFFSSFSLACVVVDEGMKLFIKFTSLFILCVCDKCVRWEYKEFFWL